MKAEEIRDEETLRAWLMGRPEAERRKAAVSIALRSACRVMPLYEAEPEPIASSFIRPDSLPLIETIVHASLVPVPAEDAEGFTGAQLRALNARDQTESILSNYSAAAALGASMETRLKKEVSEIVGNATIAAMHAAERFAASGSDIWRAASHDAALIESDRDLLATPLWHGNPPDWFRDADARMRAIWGREPATWDFWRRWWDGVLSGNQIDWDLQEAVALIPNEIWQSGPKAVAAEIARIEEMHRLRREVDELGRMLAEAKALAQVGETPANSRLHNQPPEPVDVVAELRRDLDRLRTEIGTASAELAKPLPSRTVLAAIGRSIAAYTGGKLDRMLDAAAIEAGKTAVKWTLWTLILEKVAAFADHLIRNILW